MFKKSARDAMEFYKSVFGGELTMSTYGEGAPGHHEPGQENMIMHAMLKTPNGLTLMASDAPEGKDTMTISLSGEVEDEEMLKGYWEKLIDGGRVNQPLEKAPWGDLFGMVTDKFGIDWMVNIAGAKE